MFAAVAAVAVLTVATLFAAASAIALSPVIAAIAVPWGPGV